jgi:hypothetical protein
MPTSAPHSAHHRWCDIDGTQLGLFYWVEQVTEDPGPEMLSSRLGQQGEVVGLGLDSLLVRFSGGLVVSLPPQVLRLLPEAPGEC